MGLQFEVAEGKRMVTAVQTEERLRYVASALQQL
jgi:hypothetical protein